MNVASKKYVHVGFGAADTTRKTVRFATETTKAILNKPTWRKAAQPQDKIYAFSARGQLGMAVVKFAVSKMLFIRLPTARRMVLEVGNFTSFV